MIAVFIGIAGAIATFLAFCLGSYIGFRQGESVGKKAAFKDMGCKEMGHTPTCTVYGSASLVSYTCQRCGKLVEVGK